MPREDRDGAYLWDMLQAARDAADIVSMQSVEGLLGNRLSALALERSMEVLGEAARRVSPGFRKAHPELPWKEIIGLRNILAHEYGRIDHTKLHQTALKDVPVLIRFLETVVKENQE